MRSPSVPHQSRGRSANVIPTSRRLGVLLIGITLSLILSETALRMVGFGRPSLFVADPIAGRFHRPNVKLTDTDEGHGIVSINSVGLRDREHTLEKPPHTYRIAVLGDSYAEARQVNQEETFWALLEAKLNRCRPFGEKTNIEVINFGVSGYGTAQELQTLRYRVWNYSPDMVLLAFLTGNDVCNNSRALEKDKNRPFFELAQDGTLVLDQKFLSAPAFVQRRSAWTRFKYGLAGASRLVQLALLAKERFRRSAGSRAGPGEKGRAREAEEGLDKAVYLTDGGRDWERAWDVTEMLLAQMHTEVTERGAAFLAATLSNGDQVQPNAAYTDRFMRSLGIEDVFGPDRRVAEFGRKHGFDVITLAPRLQKTAREKGIYMHGFGSNLGHGHWNKDGHRYAAEILAEHLCGRSGNRGQQGE
jgi:hypothetical protein